MIMEDKEKIIEALKEVMDPELGLDVWTLGLIYDVTIKEDKNVFIKMTLTSPMCPYAAELIAGIESGVQEQGFAKPKIDVVFDPVWKPSEEVKQLLGLA